MNNKIKELIDWIAFIACVPCLTSIYIMVLMSFSKLFPNPEYYVISRSTIILFIIGLVYGTYFFDDYLKLKYKT